MVHATWNHPVQARVGLVQHPERIDEAQNHEVDRRTTVAAIDQPVISYIEFVHVANHAPVAVVVAAVPRAEDLQLSGGTGRWWWLGGLPAEAVWMLIPPMATIARPARATRKTCLLMSFSRRIAAITSTVWERQPARNYGSYSRRWSCTSRSNWPA